MYMNNSVSLLDIYNVLTEYHHRRNKIYANLCNHLAEKLDYKTILVKSFNLERQELVLYVKKHEDIGNYDNWQELVFKKQGEHYIYYLKASNTVTNNVLKNSFILDYFFTHLMSLEEYFLLNNYSLYDTKSLYYISLNSDEIKIKSGNQKMKKIPISHCHSDAFDNAYLSDIYVDMTNLPLWLQSECELIRQPKPLRLAKRLFNSLSN